MLTIYGGRSRFCDGVSRRNFIRIARSASAGRAAATAPGQVRPRRWPAGRQVAQVRHHDLPPGGPPHQDTFDLKPDAPSEIRGEFRPIRTNVSGIETCEHLPRSARIADKYAIVRSIADAVDDHSDFMCMTGRLERTQPPGGWPSFGSVVSKLQGPATPTVPGYVGLLGRCSTSRTTPPAPAFLGVSHRSFRPRATARAT